MRKLFLSCAVLLISGLAFGQATIIAGNASNVRLVPVPFVPLVNTPSVSLDSPGTPNALFAQPSWYGPGTQAAEAAPAGSAPQSQTPESAEQFHFGAATFQSSYGAAELAQGARTSQKAVKTYTNGDIKTPDLEPGTVKFGNKTEHL